MAELYLDPTGFQKQIDSFAEGSDTIKELKYVVDNHGVRLCSVEKFLECVDYMNKTILSFGELLDLDKGNMDQIKAKWMHVDDDLAGKTIGSIAIDAIKTKFGL